MALDPKNCKPGQEQHEEFSSRIMAGNRDNTLVQYDYRNEKGKLFSTVANSVSEARKKRDEWAKINGM